MCFLPLLSKNKIINESWFSQLISCIFTSPMAFISRRSHQWLHGSTCPASVWNGHGGHQNEVVFVTLDSFCPVDYLIPFQKGVVMGRGCVSDQPQWGLSMLLSWLLSFKAVQLKAGTQYPLVASYNFKKLISLYVQLISLFCLKH